jgi:predicted small secreted protein
MSLKKFVFAAFLGILLFSAQSCNTVRGLGEDVEKLGEGMQRVD